MEQTIQKEHVVLKHSVGEDVFALFHATLFVAFGLLLYKDIGMLSGGTVGIAFLLHYWTHWNLGVVLFVLNLPFYWLSWHKMGREFTYKTFAAVALLSIWTNVLPLLVDVTQLHPLLAAVFGGLLLGSGFLILVRHRASLGGVTIVCFYWQQSKGWSAGRSLMVVDVLIVLMALVVATPQAIMYSVLGAVVMNVVLAANHRQGRYAGL